MKPSLVTCLKLQHRAAPTERNLISALRVALGDWKARLDARADSSSSRPILPFDIFGFHVGHGGQNVGQPQWGVLPGKWRQGREEQPAVSCWFNCDPSMFPLWLGWLNIE